MTLQWHHDATCAERPDIEWVPTSGETPDAKALLICGTCPVRIECLKFALKNQVVGYWGGTTSRMRSRMRSVRSRAKCPVCQGTPVVETEDGSEVCVGCAHSWRAVRNPAEPVAEDLKVQPRLRGNKPVADVPVVLAGVLSEGGGA